MNRIRVIIPLVLLAVVGLKVNAQPSDLAKGISPQVAAQPDEQLEINREALLRGASDQIRVKAATVMLFNTDPLARRCLLEALVQAANPQARAAVCKALSQARLSGRSFASKEDFLESLLNLLQEPEASLAGLAADALLIYTYDVTGKAIAEIAIDKSRPVATRLNALQALKLRPDQRAAIALVTLVGDPEQVIATQATEALVSINIPVPKDAAARKQIILDLERKPKDEVLQDWLRGQEERMRVEREAADTWKRLYLDTLDKLYQTLASDQDRSRILQEHLKAPQSERKLWALEKVYQWRVAPNTTLPPDLAPILVGLISDRDKDVRRSAARLLSLLGEVSSSQALLAQLEVESDDEVRTQVFEALGMACDVAMLPGAEAVPAEVRKKTMQWAAKFLADQDPVRAKAGADVFRRLLEKNGLGVDQMGSYLDMLAKRFEQADSPLRGELIGAMGVLCAPRSACQEQAKKVFRPIFDAVRNDPSDRVREQAVEGLINIDALAALKRLRREATSDKNPKIRKRLVEVAGQFGGVDDLEWLAGRLDAAPEDQDGAWQAVFAILGRGKADDIGAWIERLTPKVQQDRLTGDQWQAFLELAERKAVSENKPAVVEKARSALVQYFKDRGSLDKAVAVIKAWLETARSDQKKALSAELLGLYLGLEDAQAAASVVQAALANQDLDEKMALQVRDYLGQQSDQQAHIRVVSEMVGLVKVGEPRPNWDSQKRVWLSVRGPDI